MADRISLACAVGRRRHAREAAAGEVRSRGHEETVEEWTLYVSADSSEEAQEAADEIVQHCMFPEYEIIHSEYSLDAEPIDARHAVEPTRLDETQGMVCAVCLKTVEWTGIAADDPANRSGRTIPGPWVHGLLESG